MSQSLIIEGLWARAGTQSVLRGVSFRAHFSQVLGIVGPNGAGKTTLLECIAGLRPIQKGQIRLDGQGLGSFRSCAQTVSFMPDEVTLPEEMTVGTALGLPEPHPVLDALAAGALRSRPARTLSRGESKRCQLCAALMAARPIVLLDEPLGAFDPRQLRSVIPVIREQAQGRIVLLSVHQLHYAELVADRLLLLAEGRVIAQGTPLELRQRTGLMTGAFDDVFLALLEGHGGA